MNSTHNQEISRLAFSDAEMCLCIVQSSKEPVEVSTSSAADSTQGPETSQQNGNGAGASVSASSSKPVRASMERKLTDALQPES